MPKGNQVPGLPVNEEAARQFVCAHVFDTLNAATSFMSIDEAGKLCEALCEEIDHVAAASQREARWVKLTSLLIKPHNGVMLSDIELETANLLCKRQGLDPVLLED